MGLFDIFRAGKILVGAAKAVRQQRSLGRNLAALPMQQFVFACLENLNQSADAWQGRARTPNHEAASLASRLDLPTELIEFYQYCNGYEVIHGDFPAAILPIESLKIGAQYTPRLSDRLKMYWAEYGNDSENENLLSVLPPDNLIALATNSAETYVPPSIIDQSLPLCPPTNNDFTVLLLADVSKELPRGAVLAIECGTATRYPGFKVWLGSHASVFGALAAQAQQFTHKQQ